MGDQENAEASAEATVNKAMANVSISESNVSSAITNQNDNQIITNQEDTDQNIESEQNNSLVKIYVGSMPPEIDEDGLKSLLSENSLPQPETVLVKRGYAFLEFTDQIKADEAISVVDGKKKSWKTYPISCWPDLTTNFETTNPDFHDFLTNKIVFDKKNKQNPKLVLIGQKTRENLELVLQSGKQHIRFESELKLNEKILGLEHHGYTLRAEMSVGTDKKRYAISIG